MLKFSRGGSLLAEFPDQLACLVVNGNLVAHHVRGKQQALLVQSQPAGHGLHLECPQKPTGCVESLQSPFGFHVRLAKVGDEDLIFPIDHDCDRYIELPIAVAVGSPGQHGSRNWRRFFFSTSSIGARSLPISADLVMIDNGWLKA